MDVRKAICFKSPKELKVSKLPFQISLRELTHPKEPRHVLMPYDLSFIPICCFKRPQFGLYKLSNGSMDLTRRKDIKLSEVLYL